MTPRADFTIPPPYNGGWVFYFRRDQFWLPVILDHSFGTVTSEIGFRFLHTLKFWALSDGCIYSSAKDTYRDTYWAVGHQYRAPTYPLIFRAWDPLFLENDGRSSRFIAIVFKACVDIAFLYSYVEYSQFRASIEVIFWLPLLPICRGPFVAVRLRNCCI